MSLVIDEVHEFLSDVESSPSASELHGMLAGLVCAGVEEEDIDNWLPLLCLENTYLSEDEYQPFKQDVQAVFVQVAKDLDDYEMGFDILLPEESVGLNDRLTAMRSWCSGYLKALDEYGEISRESLSDDCAEFLDDVKQITELDSEDEPFDEELEASYMTLHEHLRVGVQLVYANLNVESTTNEHLGVE